MPKKDYSNRRRVAINIAPSEPVDAAKMGAGGAPTSASNTEAMITQEVATRARAQRQFVPNAKLRK